MPLNLWRRRRRRRRQLLLLMHYYLCSNFYYILGIILLILREEERIRKLSKLTNKPDRNKRYTRQRLEAMDADEADKLYRFTHFTREQLFWLAPVLLDETNWTESRDKFDCVEGLVIVTRRLRNYCDWNEPPPRQIVSPKEPRRPGAGENFLFFVAELPSLDLQGGLGRFGVLRPGKLELFP